MKNFILKLLNIILTIVMVLSAGYAVFNMVMSFLPSETQEKVYDFLQMSREYVATFSISATINAAILVGSKIIQTTSRIALTTKLTEAGKIIAQGVAANDAIIEKENTAINNMKVIEELLSSLLETQKVTAERNINASDKLVTKQEKEAYKKAVRGIEEAKEKLQSLSNISTVYEKTETKEIIKEVDNQFTGVV